MGHAVRALSDCESEPRLRELSYALASWCVSYMTVTKVTPQSGPFNGNLLIQEVPLLDSALRQNDGSITQAIGQLHQAPEILSSCDQLNLDDPSNDLLGVAKIAAHVFLNNAATPFRKSARTFAPQWTTKPRGALALDNAFPRNKINITALTSLCLSGICSPRLG